jgi:carbamoyl-phosphate synthase large subunit
MIGESLCVAVSGIHLGENSQPGPGVIRSLRQALGDRVRIVGLAYDALDSSLYAPGLLDDAFLVPYPSASPEAYLERLIEVHAEAALDVLIPCLDAELPVLLRLLPALESRGIRAVLPTRESLSLRSKDRLPALAERIGVSVPTTIAVEDLAGLARAGTQLGYPFVVKGPLCDAETVYSEEQAASAFQRLSSSWGRPILAQRFVSGDEYNVAALGDGRGGLVSAVAMRKTILTRLGKAWGAVTVQEPAVLEVAERVVRGLAWRGGCEIELLRERDGHYHLIEINPRFPAWIHLGTAAGINLPYGLLRMALGKDPEPRTPYQAGIFYVRHAEQAIGSISDIEAMVHGGRRSQPPAAAEKAVAP